MQLYSVALKGTTHGTGKIIGVDRIGDALTFQNNHIARYLHGLIATKGGGKQLGHPTFEELCVAM